MSRYKHCRDGEEPVAQELCDKLEADRVVVELHVALKQYFGHLMPEDQARLHADVLMADGKVPFTTAAFTRDYWSKPHFDKNDLMRLCFCVWLCGGETGSCKAAKSWYLLTVLANCTY